MTVGARQVLQAICNEPAFSVAMLTQLEDIGDFHGELESAINENAANKRWGCVCRLIWVAQRFPNRSLVPLLCTILEAQEDDTCLEAIVDALVIVPDERAVTALARALSYRLPGDDLAFHFNKKVITALSNIGTDAAIAAIKEAAESPEESIRRFAKSQLKPPN